MVSPGGQLPDVGGVVPEVPGYRIERQLGRGSMGVVYLAEDVQLRRKVALKILSPTMSDDELFRKRFDRESQSAAKLDHPSIVPVYTAGEAGGLLYIAMRYVDGGDVRALLDAGGPLRLEQASSMVASVADALDAAHATGIIHRDVKPANILIDTRNNQEHFYLSDFGITKIISSGTSMTSTGQIIGTIDYIAPEQIQGKAVDGRADLYALGCVLYECLTAEVPFPREETAAAMWAHVHDETPAVSTRRPDLPPEIDHIVAKAMAKQPEDRYATCRELAIALRSAATGPAAAGEAQPVAPARETDRPLPPVPAGMTSTYTPPTPPPARAPATSPARRWSWWWIAAASVVALALVGGGTAGVMKYLSSRYPTAAERALIKQVVPAALQSGCERNSEAGADAADVQASLTCRSDGDAPSTTVFTQFTSTQALDNHYRTAVGASPAVLDSGDCLNAERAEREYTNPLNGTSERVVCYQQNRSSFVAWTDSKSHTLVQATRVDLDYPKLRDWWAGVVGLPTKAQLAAEAKANQAIEEEKKRTAEEKIRADAAVKREAETKAKQAEVDAKRAEDDKKKAEQQARDEDKKKAEDDRKKAEDDRKKAEDDRKKAEDDRKKAEGDLKKAEEDRKKADELKQQSAGSNQVSPQNLDADQQRPSAPGQQQPPSALEATPDNPPTEALTGPQSPGAQLSTSSVTLSGPAPAAPGRQAQARQAPEGQQGGSAMAGSGGCVPTNAGYHLCALVPPAPGYLPGTTTSSTVLSEDRSAFVCQSDGSAYSVGNRTNHWWAWVGAGNLGVWVPTVFLAGATDNAPVADLPVCSSAGTPSGTAEEPSTRGPSIIIEPFPNLPRKDSTKDDDPPTFTFPF